MKRFNLGNGLAPIAIPRQGRGHWVLHRVRTALLAVVALAAALPAVAADYIPDPTWAGGQIAPDAFAGSATNDYIGRKMVTLPDGDVVVAGTVPPWTVDPAFGAIGLVRYKADGSGRRAWANPGQYGHYGNQYVTFPGTLEVRIEAVKDLIVHGDLLFVLADTHYANNYDAAIYVFGTDGSYKHAVLVDTQTTPSGRAVWGGGIAAYTTGVALPGQTVTNHVVYAGRRKVAAGNERITYRRYTFSTSGVLTPATAVIYPDLPECGATTHCSGFGIATGGSTTIGGTPRIYIVGSRYSDCTGICYGGWWAYAAQINSVSGDPAGMSFRYMARGRGRAIAVKPSYGVGGVRDDIYVVAERDRNCQNGMVVSAYRNDAPVSWEKVIGGADGSICLIGPFAPRTEVPTAITLQDGRLAAAGYGVLPPGCTGAQCEDTIDGAIALLNASNGNLVSPAAPSSNPQPRYYRYAESPGGPRLRHSGFHDIAGTGNGSFMVAGDVRYPNTDDWFPTVRGKQQYATLRVIEEPDGSGELLFEDGFEGGGGQPPQPAQLRGTNIGGMTLAYSYCPQAGAGPVPGTHFHTFDQRLVDYYAGKGMKTLRVKFTWECMQKELNGPIPAVASGNYKAYFDAFKGLVDYASNVRGMQVVMTPWQSNAGGGLCGACYRGQLIGSAAVTNAHFSDFWTKMADHFKSNPRVVFSLINEPNNMSTMQWFSAAQAAITAIRGTGATNSIFVPGNGYTAASTWDMNFYDTAATKRSNAYGWLNARGVGLPLLDPQNNLVIEVHTYVDENQGGLDNGITSANAARDHIKHTVDWARVRDMKVYLAEIGMYSGNALAAQTWSNFVAYASANTDTLIGFAWWAGGYPGWWNDMNAPYFSITPTNAANYTGDNANMDMIESAFH